MTPRVVIREIRLIHIFQLILLLTFAGICLNKISRDSLIFTVLLAGAFWGQFGSITNDIPMYFTGFAGLATFLSLQTDRRISRKIAALLIFFLTALLVRNVDSSSTLIPILLLVGGTITVLGFANAPSTNRDIRVQFSTTAWLVSTALVLITMYTCVAL